MNKKNKRRRYAIHLINGESKNTQDPETFLIPTVEQRKAVVSGNFVKIGFMSDDPECFGEWMWVKVCECVEGEIYAGMLANRPLCIPLKPGAWIRFGPEYILDISRD